jgi:hypothetical protein
MLVERSTMHSVHRSGDALGTDAKDSMGPLVSHSSCTTVLHCRNCGAVSRGQTSHACPSKRSSSVQPASTGASHAAGGAMGSRCATGTGCRSRSPGAGTRPWGSSGEGWASESSPRSTPTVHPKDRWGTARASYPSCLPATRLGPAGPTFRLNSLSDFGN